MLVIARPGFVFFGGKEGVRTYGTHEALAEDGRFETTRFVWFSTQGGTSDQTFRELKAIREILPTLPPSQNAISIGLIEEGNRRFERGKRFQGRTVGLGFRRQSSRVTRVSDMERLPPEVVGLFEVL